MPSSTRWSYKIKSAAWMAFNAFNVSKSEPPGPAPTIKTFPGFIETCFTPTSLARLLSRFCKRYAIQKIQQRKLFKSFPINNLRVNFETRSRTKRGLARDPPNHDGARGTNCVLELWLRKRRLRTGAVHGRCRVHENKTAGRQGCAARIRICPRCSFANYGFVLK